MSDLPPNAPRLDVRGLTVRPAPETEPVRLDLRLAGGRATVLRGPSGSGKTTLLRCLARLRPVDAGDVRLDDVPWLAIPPRSWRRQVAYAPSRPEFVPGDGWTNLQAPFRLRIADGTPFPRERALALAERLRLRESLFARDPSLLSDGERARLSLLRTLLTGPAALLADEPTAALDGETRRAVVATLAAEMTERGAALLMVDHHDGVAEALHATTITLGEGRA